MAVGGKVSGSIPTLIVGVIELLDTIINLAIFIKSCVDNESSFQHSGHIAATVVVAIYILLEILATGLLIYATLSSKSFYIRKSICIGWILFRILWFIIALLFLILGKWWQDNTALIIFSISTAMWTVFNAVVVYYIIKLSKALQVKRSTERKLQSKRPKNVVDHHHSNNNHQNSLPPLPPAFINMNQQLLRQPWSTSKFQLVKNEHVFTTKPRSKR